MNTFTHIREFPDAKFKEVVRPNFDTLYSLGWLDLTASTHCSNARIGPEAHASDVVNHEIVQGFEKLPVVPPLVAPW
jgi:hypothetical protein